MNVSSRLAEILDDYTAILSDIERRHTPAEVTPRPPVLLPADQQRGCTAPAIAHADQAAERHRGSWLG